MSYRQLIRIEIYKLEKHLIGEQEYEPFVSLCKFNYRKQGFMCLRLWSMTLVKKNGCKSFKNIKKISLLGAELCF